MHNLPAPAVNSADFGRSSNGFLARVASVMAQRFMDPEHIPEEVGSIPGLTPRGKDPAWPGGVERAPTQLGSPVALAVLEAGSSGPDPPPSLGTSICRGGSPQKTEDIGQKTHTQIISLFSMID